MYTDLDSYVVQEICGSDVCAYMDIYYSTPSPPHKSHTYLEKLGKEDWLVNNIHTAEPHIHMDMYFVVI